MKYLVVILVFCSFTNIANAQNGAKVALFIEPITGKENIVYEDSVSKGIIFDMRESLERFKKVPFYRIRQDSVIYTDSLGKQTMLSLVEVRRDNSKRFYNRTKSIKLDSLILSESEKKYINSELDRMKNYKWSNKLLPNYKLITTDSLSKIFMDRKNGGWQYLNKQGIYNTCNFSLPIFLRNDQYCLFCYSYSCGWLCGHGEFALYKNENGKWVKFTTLYTMNS